MRHTFRLNVYQKGYTLYSGQSSSYYREYPLDMPSDEISRSYLAAQKRIDAILRLNTMRWHFSVTNFSHTEHPLVAYGTLLTIEDDRGRPGISFVHAIETDTLAEIAEVVRKITQILSPKTIDDMSRTLARIAKGNETPQVIIGFLTEQFSMVSYAHTDSLMYSSRPIHEIRHDCGGASAAAWLAMTLSHLNTPAPWEIYEVYSSQTSQLSTVSSSANASSSYLLSDYLYALIRDQRLLDNLCISRLGNPGSRAAAPQIAVPRQEAIAQLDGGDRTKFPDNMASPDPLPEQIHRQPVEPQVAERRRVEPPPDGVKVRLDGLFGNELSLISIAKKSSKYRIRAMDCRSVAEELDYFLFTIEQYKLFGLQIYKLVLPKDGLSERETAQIEDFRRSVTKHHGQG